MPTCSLGPPNISWPFIPLWFLHTWFSLLFPFCVMRASTSRLSSNITFSGKLCMLSFLLQHLEMTLSFNIYLQCLKLQSKRRHKICLCPVSLGLLGRTQYRARILSWLSLALSSCVPATSCNFSLPPLPPTRTDMVFKVPLTQAVLSCRYLFNKRFLLTVGDHLTGEQKRQ